jgi:thiamine biosynthesis lipoprotein
MRSCSPSAVERARPLLGTTVAIRVEGVDDATAHRAIDAAFDAVADVHRLMSFHEPDSDLSRLHRARHGVRVQLAAPTAEVLREALRLAALSEGAFDVSVGARLVAWGLLPRPAEARAPAEDANWRHIHLDDQDGVRLERPLWIDLGGIAKGYAVDRAAQALRAHGIAHGCVNAGGDLRTLGDGPHRVAIDTGQDEELRPVLELGEAAVATSHGRGWQGASDGPHVDPRTGTAAGRGDCVSVVAARCMHADALTKIVLALGPSSAELLQHYEATAYLQDARGGWTTLGAAP